MDEKYAEYVPGEHKCGEAMMTENVTSLPWFSRDLRLKI
jgi:hypothetical protein